MEILGWALELTLSEPVQKKKKKFPKFSQFERQTLEQVQTHELV